MSEQEPPEKKGFIALLWEALKKSKPDVEAPDVYRKMKISKQNFFNQLGADREIQPRSWRNWRRGMGITKCEFWKKAQEHYDP